MVEPPARKALHAPGAVKGERFVVDDAAASKGIGEEKQWRSVYADFIALKKKLGEPTDRLSFDKFKGTLQRNKEALMARHGCERVKFRVYEKQGRAALKASPVK